MKKIYYILFFLLMTISPTLAQLDWNDSGNNVNGTGVYTYTNVGNATCPNTVTLNIAAGNTPNGFGAGTINRSLPDSDSDQQVLYYQGFFGENDWSHFTTIAFENCVSDVEFGLADVDFNDSWGIRGIDCDGNTVYPTISDIGGNGDFLIYDPDPTASGNTCTNCTGFTFPLTSCAGQDPECAVPNAPCTANPYPAYKTVVGGGGNTNTSSSTVIVSFPGVFLQQIEMQSGYQDTDGAYDCPDAGPLDGDNGVSTNQSPVSESGLNNDGTSNYQTNAFTQLGEITYLDECLLPIELSSFTVIANGLDADLEWVTASETNNSHFQIEVSTTGLDEDFEQIDRVESKAVDGNSQVELNYIYTDKIAYGRTSDSNPVLYYRLKQTDFDGTYSYTPVRLVNFDQVDIEMSLFPNPIKRGDNAVIISDEVIETIRVFSLIGELMQVLEEVNETNVTSVPTGNLAPGMYLIEINGSRTLKLIVQ